VATLGLVGAGYLVAGCSEESRDETGAIDEAGELDAFSIKVGDCVDNVVTDSASTEVESVGGVPCAQPHQAEAYHAFDLPEGDGTFPGDAAVGEQADAGCIAAFQGFVGLAYEQSALDYTWLVPTLASWDERDDREVLCFVIEPGPTGELIPLTGTVAGAAR
jgi:hypothetical protein